MEKLQINTPVGIASYPHLTKPDEFKGVESYKCNLRLDESNDEAIKFIQTVKKFAEKCRLADLTLAEEKLSELDPEAKNPKAKKQYEAAQKMVDTLSDQESYRLPFEQEWGDDDELTGNILLRTKSKAAFKGRDGNMISLAPKFYAADAKPMTTRPDVRGGSRIALGLTFVPYAAGGDIGAGISARINSVQLISLAGGSAGGDAGFTAQSGYKEDTFDANQSEDMDY